LIGLYSAFVYVLRIERVTLGNHSHDFFKSILA
jgi:hypothetical protein